VAAAKALPPSRACSSALAVVAVVVAADQFVKQLVIHHVRPGNPVEVIFGLKLANVRNSGIAFGLLKGAGDGAVLVLTLAAIGLLVAYFAAHAARPGLWLAVGLIVGGALGNLADRIRIGAAIDFIDPPLWPAFNIADIAIVAGVALLTVVLLAPEEQDGSGA
jgi:signal peptidase II